MRRLAALSAALLLLLARPAAAFDGPREEVAMPRTMSLLEWLNFETRQSDLILIGQVQQDAYPDPQRGWVKAILKVGDVYLGPKIGPLAMVTIKPGFRGGRYMVPSPLMKGQWALLFCRNEGGRWVAPPLGRIVETPFKGLTFYPSYNVVIQDASPSLGWPFVLKQLNQLIVTRREIIDGHLPALRAAQTKEERDRQRLAIEWEVKEQLGLPLP